MRITAFVIVCILTILITPMSHATGIYTEDHMSFLSVILLPMTVRETGASVVYAAVEPIGLETISIEITSADEILAVRDGIVPVKGSQKILIELNRQGKTIIIVTHESDIATQAQYRLHMKDGYIDCIDGNSDVAN